jgi:phosphatidylglycerophosphatase A
MRAMDSEDIASPDLAPAVVSRLAVWLATGIGIGLVTPAPGTVAGLWGLPVAAAVCEISQAELRYAVMAVLALLAVPVCHLAAAALGSNGDPGPIVLDEIVALPIVFVGVPGMSWPLLIAGYLLFRLCDVWKPGLASSAEKLPGGWGIVADDCVAAVMACLLLHGAIWLDGRVGVNWLGAS